VVLESDPVCTLTEAIVGYPPFADNQDKIWRLAGSVYDNIPPPLPQGLFYIGHGLSIIW
jgi:hypothetical protein